MNQGIIIGTHKGSPWLENCLSSLFGTPWPLVVIENDGFELGKIAEAVARTNFKEFLFLPDSVEVKDRYWIQQALVEHAGVSVSVNRDPGPFGCYMGKYRRSVLQQVGIPQTLTKRDAVWLEVEWGRRYYEADPRTVILFPDLRDSNVFEEKFGRNNMILENESLKKYKGTWTWDQLPPEPRPVYSRLYDHDIYRDFHPLAKDLHGWQDHSAHFHRLAAGAKLIVEIGTWKGRSALALCDAAPGAEVVCVDTWLGAGEMWEDHTDATRYGSLALKHGFPCLYYQFLSNVVRHGRESQITPMPMPSTIALRLLAKWNIRPDLVFIDGSHDYEDVATDIRLAKALNPGVICGDDWGLWEGVTRAATEAGAHGEEGNFWII